MICIFMVESSSIAWNECYTMLGISHIGTESIVAGGVRFLLLEG